MTISQQLAQVQPRETFPGKDKRARSIKFHEFTFAGVNVFFDENLPVRRDSPDKGTIPVSEAARMLFVSSSCVVRLIGEGKLRARPKAELRTFLRRDDVLAYKAQRATNAKAFFDEQTQRTGTYPAYGGEAASRCRSIRVDSFLLKEPMRKVGRVFKDPGLCAAIVPAASLLHRTWRN